ncbi:MAG: sulfatase-like hydrolase/transferase, partial [Gemmatimonadetes bacterium]|nr:sulfatase-like hydrolase/transferase [Gemmatimonadota bacterium]
MSCSKFLLISIDCWRSDALSRTNPSLLTPKFDVLTKGYAFAEKFFVTAPATRPSHTSLFTGLYPFEHGLFGQTYLKMFSGVTNLLQTFADAGFEVSGRSQRPEVFRFLDFEPFIGPLDPAVQDQTLASIEPTLQMLEGAAVAPQLRF